MLSQSIVLNLITPKHTSDSKTMTSLTSDDIQNLLTLIDFHDDWDEVKDVWGFDIEPLFDKLHNMLQEAN